MRPGEPAPKLFEGPAQQIYEDLRNRGVRIWDQIKQIAPREDRKASGNYPETERLLAELNQINEDYLALVLPRIEELLVPMEKRRTVVVSTGNYAARPHEAEFGVH
jgi:hypothetical protein